MPIYEYHCAKCDHEFEREQRITEDPVKTCPSCRSRRVKKLISQTSFVLKGGGWYNDLYSSAKDSKSDAKDDTKDDAKKEGKSADKKDAKKDGKKSSSSEAKSKKKSPKSAA